jgi:hypothetical protein
MFLHAFQEVFSLHKLPDSELSVLDFESDAHDVRLRSTAGGSEEDVRPLEDCSLRAFLQIAYLRPKFTVTLRGVAVDMVPITNGLIQLKTGFFDINDAGRKQARFELGLDVITAADGSSRLSERQGICMYWHGRLIRPFELLGVQKKRGGVSLAHGVIGLVELNYLVPNSSKREFLEGKNLSRATIAMANKLAEFVDLVRAPGPGGEAALIEMSDIDARLRLTVEGVAMVATSQVKAAAIAKLQEAAMADGRRFLTCDAPNCGKLRFVREEVSEADFLAILDKDLWCCTDNAELDGEHASCEAPQEQPRAAGKRQQFLVATADALPANWKTFKVMRNGIANGSDHEFIHFSPEGKRYTLKCAL